MSNITYRLVKGKELTFDEVDENFRSLDSDIIANRRYFDSELEQFGLGRDSDFLAILAQRDSDAAAIILNGIARHDSDIASLNDRVDSEHAWNVVQHSNLDSSLSARIDSEHGFVIDKFNEVAGDIQIYTAGTGISIDGSNVVTNTSPDQTVTLTAAGSTVITGSYPNFTIESVNTDTDTTYTAGTGLTLVGTEFQNTAPDQTVSITGQGGTTVSGTYPTFTVSSSAPVTYTAGTGLTLVGTEFRNDAPDQTVSLTGAGGLTVSGTYPNFTLTQGAVTSYVLPLAANGTRGGVQVGYATNAKNYAVQLSGEKMYVNVPWTDNDTTYTAGTGLTLVGTEFRNDAPDQTVALTGTGGIAITGTYPNFTVDGSGASGTTYTAGNGLQLTGDEFSMTGNYTGTFTATGDVVAYSDMALKSEVTAIDQALDKLMSITGYTYNREGSDRRHAGVMAQDVEKVLPEVVHTSEDGTKGVAYGNMMGLVIEAIRELKTQVEELKRK